MSEFQRSLAKVLQSEGGYVNLKSDPGGPTNKGVTQAVYDDFRKSRSMFVQSVKSITEAEIEEIYRARYWDLIKGDSLPVGVSYAVFDGAVNSGVSQSAKWLQRAIGVKADGLIGPSTIAATSAYANAESLIDAILDQRLKFLKALKTWNTFGKGWSRRVEDVRSTAKSWARGNSFTPVKTNSVEEQPKAYVKDVQKAPSTAVGDAVAGGGLQSTIITQAIAQLTPLAQNDFVAKVLTWLTVASVVIGLAGLAYGVYARRRKAEVKDAISAEPT